MTPVLCDIRAKARKLVGYFRSSTLAKLVSVQRQLGRPTLKLMQEVETRWNSTYHMLQCLVDLREPVCAALASLNTEITTLTSAEFTTISGCLSLLSGFNDATIELSEEKNVSGSKVVPLLKMLEQMLHEEMAKTAVAVAKEMGEHLLRQLRERLHTLQSMSIMSLATLLGNKLWHKLDQTVNMSRKTKNATADATVEVQRYLAEPNIGRLEDPLNTKTFPCERVFSKAREVVSKKINRLSPKTVEKILFLNKNQ
ncbi:hypothetical protein JOQ06_001389 [Pogonophryne albipinna]|uniref:HAT C-terminal dimerisation domain-containing protein n=1 Tax=Pogonophryne albipinna TaxID=1090488 RepID=A0AAD6FJ24_9TELE|nr:hypothetical protein JOQ06_001389 [Pogonophryne albipinna]